MLKSWIMDNYCTQGCSMHFEELTVEKLGELKRIVEKEIDSKIADQKLETESKTSELRAQLVETQRQLDELSS